MSERKSKMFWVVEETGVRYLKAWECADSHGTKTEYWWCPQAGFSGGRSHYFFQSQKKALEKLVENLHAEKKSIEAILAKAGKQYRRL